MYGRGRGGRSVPRSPPRCRKVRAGRGLLLSGARTPRRQERPADGAPPSAPVARSTVRALLRCLGRGRALLQLCAQRSGELLCPSAAESIDNAVRAIGADLHALGEQLHIGANRGDSVERILKKDVAVNPTPTNRTRSLVRASTPALRSRSPLSSATTRSQASSASRS